MFPADSKRISETTRSCSKKLQPGRRSSRHPGISVFKENQNWNYLHQRNPGCQFQTHQFSYTVPLALVGDDHCFQSGLSDIAPATIPTDPRTMTWRCLHDSSVHRPPADTRKGWAMAYSELPGQHIHSASISPTEWISHLEPQRRLCPRRAIDVKYWVNNHGANGVSAFRKPELSGRVRRSRKPDRSGRRIKSLGKSAFLNHVPRRHELCIGWQMVSGV